MAGAVLDTRLPCASLTGSSPPLVLMPKAPQYDGNYTLFSVAVQVKCGQLLFIRVVPIPAGACVSRSPGRP